MESSWKEFLLCAPIYAPGLVLIVVALVALSLDRKNRKKVQEAEHDGDHRARPPGDTPP